MFVGDEEIQLTDEEENVTVTFFLPDNFRVCRSVQDNSDQLNIYKLIGKWKYDPNRRAENKAGSEPVTEKQKKYLLSLRSQYPTLFSELETILNACWGVSLDGWTKADAMFVINSLVR